MTKIYDQHRAAFSNVSAWVVMRKGERVATVSVKFPKDGAGRLWAYVHYIGTEMQRDFAGGYGYAKTDAAVSGAGSKIHNAIEKSGRPEHWSVKEFATLRNFIQAIGSDGGESWDRKLRDAGFEVFQAV